MIVLDLVEDLRRMIAAVPKAAEAPISVGCYVDDSQSELSLHPIGSYLRDADGGFNLVPVGVGPNLDLAERQWTVASMLEMLERTPDSHAAPLHIVRGAKDTGTYTATLGAPAWGVGLHDEAGAYVLWGDIGNPDST